MNQLRPLWDGQIKEQTHTYLVWAKEQMDLMEQRAPEMGLISPIMFQQRKKS